MHYGAVASRPSAILLIEEELWHALMGVYNLLEEDV